MVVLEESMPVFRSLQSRPDAEVVFWEGGFFMGDLLSLLLSHVLVLGRDIFIDSLSLLLTSSGCAEVTLFFLEDRFFVDICGELFDR